MGAPSASGLAYYLTPENDEEKSWNLSGHEGKTPATMKPVKQTISKQGANVASSSSSPAQMAYPEQEGYYGLDGPVMGMPIVTGPSLQVLSAAPASYVLPAAGPRRLEFMEGSSVDCYQNRPTCAYCGKNCADNNVNSVVAKRRPRVRPIRTVLVVAGEVTREVVKQLAGVLSNAFAKRRLQETTSQATTNFNIEQATKSNTKGIHQGCT